MKPACLYLWILLALLASNTSARANGGEPAWASAYFDSAELVGSGDYSRLFWNIYRARLYTETGQYQSDANFALSLEYQRDLRGEQIVDASLELIVEQNADPAQLPRWRQQLTQVIPDVERGDTLTGVRLPEAAHFYHNGKRLGSLEDPELIRYFFNIWLAETTRAPDLRRALIGASRG